MKTYTEAINSITKKLTVSFDSKECENVHHSVLEKVQAQVTLPGFRKGKVPVTLLQQRFREVLYEEFRNALINQALEHLKNEEKLKIAAILKADLTSLDQGQSLLLEIELEPEFELPNYRSFQIEEHPLEVSVSEINAFIERLQKQQAGYKKVDRPVQNTDYVKISYQGFIDDRPVDEFENVPNLWLKQKSTWEEAGAADGLGIPEIVSGLIGLKTGDTKEISVKFPKNFPAKELHGKKASYQVTIEEVQEVMLPKLDEDFFKKNQVKDLAELENIAKQTLLNRKEQEFATEQKHKISEFLIHSMTCDLPGSWIDKETDIVLQEMVNLFSSHGIKSEILEEQKSALIEKAQAVARDRIKLNLCFEKIFKQENLKMDARDIELVLVQEAAMRHIKPEKLLQQVQRDETIRTDIQRKAFQSKIINWLYLLLSKKNPSKA